MRVIPVICATRDILLAVLWAGVTCNLNQRTQGWLGCSEKRWAYWASASVLSHWVAGDDCQA
jgi:hypothetical protein